MNLQKTPGSSIGEAFRAESQQGVLVSSVPFDQVAETLGVPGHLLHLWTKKFPQIQPSLSEGKQVFSARTFQVLQGVKKLLVEHSQEYKNVQKILDEKGEDYMISIGKYSEIPKEILTAVKNKDRNALENRLTISSRLSASAETRKSGSKQQHSTLSGTSVTRNTVQDVNKRIEAAFQSAKGEYAELGDLTPEETQVIPGSYEENWSSFMREIGRADPPSSAPADFPDDIEDEKDILYIDQYPRKHGEKITNFGLKAEPALYSGKFATPALYNSTEHEMIIEETTEKKPEGMKMLETSHNKDYHHTALSVENQEILYHALAKLNIIKTELKITADVLNKTLKSFGYSAAID